MSGGVDSSAAAFLTQQAGYACIGCTMKLYENDDAGISRENSCCALDDIADARAVAYRLGMPYYVFNFTEEFRRAVIGKFCGSYLRGETPNPCIDCNRYLKFGALMERAAVLGCGKLVTGHYAQVVRDGDGWALRKGADASKDQSYVLYTLTQAQLSHLLLPLGGMTKVAVRELAEAQGFVNARKHDSQDICFVPDGDYARVIALHTGVTPAPGDFTDPAGNVIGRHAGITHYTVGQRRGLGLALGHPAYVCGLDVPQNRVIIGTKDDLMHRRCTVRDVNWISGRIPEQPLRCCAKIRYRHTEQPALLTFTGADAAELCFDAPQRAMTAGQAAVFYDGDTVLGGGVIAGTE